MLENKGRIVQEHTASMVPDTEATEYATHFFAWAPKYFNTAPWLTNTEMTPAMKKAGNKHRITCSRAYHLVRSRVATMASLNRRFSKGIKNARRKKNTIQNKMLISFFHSMVSFCFNKKTIPAIHRSRMSYPYFLRQQFFEIGAFWYLLN
jgi:hypothetical protein